MRISQKNSRKRINRSQYIILGFLMRGPASGYDIVKLIRTSTAFFWVEGYGQIYPTLEKLVEEKHIIAKKDPATNRNKMIYSITPSGRRELHAWLILPHQATIERNELLLKIFFGENASPKIALQHLNRARNEAHEYWNMLKSIQKSLVVKIPNYKKRVFIEATLRAGIIGAEALIKWCDETEKEMVLHLKIKN